MMEKHEDYWHLNLVCLSLFTIYSFDLLFSCLMLLKCFLALNKRVITAFHGLLGVYVNLVPSTSFHGGKKRRYIFTSTLS